MYRTLLDFLVIHGNGSGEQTKHFNCSETRQPPPLHGQVEAGICIPGQSYKVYVLSLSVLTAIIPSEPGLASFIEAKKR